MKKNIIQSLAILFAGLLLAGLTGCASAARGLGGATPTEFISHPSGAVVVDSEHGNVVGTTPFALPLSPKHDYTFQALLSGYRTETVVSVPRTDTVGGLTMYGGNGLLVLASPIAAVAGYGVDFVTKDYKSHPRELVFNLVPVAQQQAVLQPPPQNIYVQPPPATPVAPPATMIQGIPVVPAPPAPTPTYVPAPSAASCPSGNPSGVNTSGNPASINN